MITIIITITDQGGGAGVDVTSTIQPGASETTVAAWAGTCQSINKYMHEHGAPSFDCMKKVTKQ